MPATTKMDAGSLKALPPDARQRVFIFNVAPTVDDGRYPIKRVEGDEVRVEVDLICDGHDRVDGVVLYRKRGANTDRGENAESGSKTQQPQDWQTAPLSPILNDRWQGSFTVTSLGTWEFTVEAWVDAYGSWLWGLGRKVAAGQADAVDFLAGALLLEDAASRSSGAGIKLLRDVAAQLRGNGHAAMLLERASDAPVVAAARSNADRSQARRADRIYEVTVDPAYARFSTWYELFPRSFGPDGKHGSFADIERMLPQVAGMGFDVLYLPPIHPIGGTHRKGRNNTLEAGPGDPGSPWAIGAVEGGHRDYHPELGSEADFRRLVESARDLGVQIALDMAFQASPDHPYVGKHPDWFVHRADGSIQYAENPPKKYQDVYAFDLAGESSPALWQELLEVFLLWIDRGVNIFRVDNPHTKPISFWQWCIARIKDLHPQVVFLAEAFTRPKLMQALAKVGFSQSYTYFTWRTTRWDLSTYMTELAQAENFMRPNFWPNTPDILPENLQYAGRPAFIARLVLAGTLSSNYGIYGPPYEAMENVPRPGAEEYIDNEKYQLRRWSLDRPDTLRPVITRLNRIRRENAALHAGEGLTFHETDNEFLLCYSKATRNFDSVILTVVNLDAHHRHAGWIELNLKSIGVQPGEVFQAHDLLSESRYQWQGTRVFVELEPVVMPAHIFRLRRRVRSEHAFEYFA